MQAVIDSAPHASRYFSDAFNTYRELCWWGEHASMYDKSQTYSVEGDNAELRHYLARLTRRSRCFSKCIHALRRAGDPNAPPFALPPSRAILRRRFAGFVTVGQHDHVAHVARQIERPEARG